MNEETSRKTIIVAPRRRLLKLTAMAAATGGLYGMAPFFGPWKHHHAWAQSGQKKPIVIGLTIARAAR